ncbi:MAG: hypothetical protein GXO07_02390 [Crenarchaeota archaeon]|nr:hypothetical protein [Thermoproteota archaeon]
MRLVALLLLAAVLQAAPLEQAIGSLENATQALLQAFHSPVPAVKAASTRFANISFVKSYLIGIKANLEGCYASFKDVVAKLDSDLNTKLVPPVNATAALGEMRLYADCTAFYYRALNTSRAVLASFIGGIQCADPQRAPQTVQKLLEIRSVSDYLKIAEELKALGGPEGAFGCYVKLQGEKALRALEEATALWASRVEELEQSYRNYEKIVVEYVNSLR